MTSQFDEDVDWLKNERRRERDIDARREFISQKTMFDGILADEQRSNANGERILLALFAVYAIALWLLL